tara:strand:- start:2367 stop:2561 length:195 start_codon:yes stop_codon:yes gene_type:complete
MKTSLKQKAEKIMNTQEYLSVKDYKFCKENTNDVDIDTSYIGNFSNKSYLNLRLYSEHDQEKTV